MNKHKYILSAIQDQLQLLIKSFRTKQLYEKVKNRKLNQEAIDLIMDRLLQKDDVKLAMALLENKNIDRETQQQVMVFLLQQKSEIGVNKCFDLAKKLNISKQQVLRYLIKQKIYFRLQQLLHTSILQPKERKDIFEYLMKNGVSLGGLGLKFYKTDTDQCLLLAQYYKKQKDLNGLWGLVHRRGTDSINEQIPHIAFMNLIDLFDNGNVDVVQQINSLRERGKLTRDEIEYFYKKIEQFNSKTYNKEMIQKTFRYLTDDMKQEIIDQIIQKRDVVLFSHIYLQLTEQQMNVLCDMIAKLSQKQLQMAIANDLFLTGEVRSKVVELLMQRLEYKKLYILYTCKQLTKPLLKVVWEFLCQHDAVKQLYQIIKKESFPKVKVQQFLSVALSNQAFGYIKELYELNKLSDQQQSRVIQYIIENNLYQFSYILSYFTTKQQFVELVERLYNNNRYDWLNKLKGSRDFPTQYLRKIHKNKMNNWNVQPMNKISKQLLKIAKYIEVINN